MNGFEIMADTYRTQGKEHKAELYEYLARCSDDDINTLYDSSAFNEIVKAYLKRAVKELVKEDVIDEEQGACVCRRFRLLHDEMSSCDVLRGV